MTTFVPFVPEAGRSPPFAFQATLDGQNHQISVLWNVFELRWYLRCLDQTQTVIFNLPMIGSPDAGQINIAAGYFLFSSLIYRVSTQTFEVNP